MVCNDHSRLAAGQAAGAVGAQDNIGMVDAGEDGLDPGPNRVGEDGRGVVDSIRGNPLEREQ